MAKLKGPHICTSIFVQKDHHQLDANFAANAISNLMMDDLSMMVANIQNVLDHLFGSHEESFEKFPRLLLIIKESNL